MINDFDALFDEDYADAQKVYKRITKQDFSMSNTTFGRRDETLFINCLMYVRQAKIGEIL